MKNNDYFCEKQDSFQSSSSTPEENAINSWTHCLL